MTIFLFKDNSDLHVQISGFFERDDIPVQVVDSEANARTLIHQSKQNVILHLPIISENTDVRQQLADLCSIDSSSHVVAVSDGDLQNTLYAFSVGSYICLRQPLTAEELYCVCKNVAATQATIRQLRNTTKQMNELTRLASIGVIFGETFHLAQNILGSAKSKAQFIHDFAKEQKFSMQAKGISEDINRYFEHIEMYMNVLYEDKVDSSIVLCTCIENSFHSIKRNENIVLELQCKPDLTVQGYSEQQLFHFFRIIFSDIVASTLSPSISIAVESQNSSLCKITVPFSPLGRPKSTRRRSRNISIPMEAWARVYLEAMGGEIEMIEAGDQKWTVIKLPSHVQE